MIWIYLELMKQRERLRHIYEYTRQNTFSHPLWQIKYRNVFNSLNYSSVDFQCNLSSYPPYWSSLSIQKPLFFLTFHSTVKWVEANYWTAIKKKYLKIEGSTLAQYELTMACVGVSCNFHDWFESLFSHCCDHYAAILYREQKKIFF